MSRWFRWYEGTTEDGKFRVVARMSRVTVRDVIAVWAFILEDAAHFDHRGVCVRNKDFISAILDFEEGVVETILSAMQNLGMVSVEATNITICHWNTRQFESDQDTTAAERQRRKRDRDRSSSNGSVTRDSATQTTDTDTEAEREGSPRAQEKSRPGKKEGTTIAPDWQPDEDGLTDAQEANVADIPREVKRFVDYNLAEGNLKLDWDAAWRVWLSRAPDFRANGSTAPPAPTPGYAVRWVEADDPRWAVAAERWAREHNGKRPIAVGSKHGNLVGFHFPADWPELSTVAN